MKLHHVLIGRHPKKTLIRASILAVVSFAFFSQVMRPVRVSGESMLPTYQSGRINFVNLLAFRIGAPGRGDVVTIRLAGNRVMFMKRIIGLPGERFTIHDGIVSIDGKPLDEPYVVYRSEWNVEEFTLAEDEYYVIGDNRGMAIEDHQQGIAKRSRLAGKVMF
jgi:signal peptidase I